MKKIKLLEGPIEIELDRHPDGTPFSNEDYPSVSMVPYEGEEPYCCTSDDDCWCEPKPEKVRRPTREGRGVTIGTQEALDREDAIIRSNTVMLQLRGECR